MASFFLFYYCNFDYKHFLSGFNDTKKNTASYILSNRERYMKIICIKCPKILKPLVKLIFKKQLSDQGYTMS